jgi:hypothetical protein
MQISHPAGAKRVKGIVVDNITIPDADFDNAFDVNYLPNQGDMATADIVFTFHQDWLQKFTDSYAVTNVVLEDGTTEEVSAQIIFDPLNTPYLWIESESDWVTEMTPDRHGQSSENISIRKDLDSATTMAVTRRRGRSL